MAFSWLSSEEIADLTMLCEAGGLEHMRPALRWLTSAIPKKVPSSIKDWFVLTDLDRRTLKMHLKIMAEASRFHRRSNLRKYLPAPVCEVRPSRIHGLGVFATQDIEPCHYVTIYPCDGATWHSDATDDDTCMHFGWPSAVTWTERHTYQQEVRPPPGARAMAIYGDPLLHDDPHFVGHMINDGAKCSSFESAEVYEAISERKANCHFISSIGAIISSRHIKAGEELLTSYGHRYWLRLREIEEKSTPAVCLPDAGVQLEELEELEGLEEPACQSGGVVWLDAGA